MDTTGQLEWVRPPRQARSRETQDRILDAAEELILEQGAEAATVTAIARRARSSVGSLYARFADKEAVVRCVLERFSSQALATVEAALAPARWEGVPLRDVLESAVRFTARVLRERRELVAAVAVRSPADPEIRVTGERIGELVVARIRELLEHRNEVPAHPSPETGIRMCVWLVLSALEGRAVCAPPTLLSDDRVAAEIAAATLAYLGLASAPECGDARLVG